MYAVYSDGFNFYLGGAAGTDSATIRVLKRSDGTQFSKNTAGDTGTVYGLVVDGAAGSRSHHAYSGTGFIYACGDLHATNYTGLWKYDFLSSAATLPTPTGIIAADGLNATTNIWTSITQSRNNIYAVDDQNNTVCFTKDFEYHFKYWLAGGGSETDYRFFNSDPVWYSTDMGISGLPAGAKQHYNSAVSQFDNASDRGIESITYLNGFVWLVGEPQITDPAVAENFDLVVLDAKTGQTFFAGTVGNYSVSSSLACQYGITTDGASIYITGSEDDTGTTYYFTRKLYSPMQPTMIKKHAGTERFRSPRHILCTVTADEVD